MNIELDGMPLIQHVRDPETGATKEIRSVYNIDTSERRRIVEHRIPGLEGGVLQDLGREPVRISFDGIFYGEVSKDNLERLRSKFKMGKPVSFNSDLTGAAEVTQVLIEELSIEDVGGITNRYKYSIVLREYLVPPAPSRPPPSQEENAQQQVQQQADDELDSAYVEGQVTDEEGNPLKGVTVIVSSTEGEWREPAITDDQGYYRTKSKFKPGRYTVAFELEEYERAEKKAEVKSSKGE